MSVHDCGGELTHATAASYVFDVTVPGVELMNCKAGIRPDFAIKMKEMSPLRVVQRLTTGHAPFIHGRSGGSPPKR